MNLFRFSVRNDASCEPERSSSMKVKPPEVPTPGMDGGEKAKACASGSLASSAFSCELDGGELLVGLVSARSTA